MPCYFYCRKTYAERLLLIRRRNEHQCYVTFAESKPDKYVPYNCQRLHPLCAEDQSANKHAHYACICAALLFVSDASVCMVTSSLNSPHVPALEVECAVFQDAHLKDPSGVWLTLCYKGVVSRVGKPRCCNSMLIVILTIIVCDKTCRRHWLCQHEHQRWLSRAPAGSVARTRCSAAFSSLQITACIRRCR